MSDETPPARPRLEIAIEGEGISPRDITIRHLSELLDAAASTLDALAAESARPAVQPSLREIRKGSAAYELSADTVAWAPMVGAFYEAVRTRGESHGPRVRTGLARLFRSGKIGGVRVRAVGFSDPRYDAPVHLALPLETVPYDVVHTHVIFGRVVGVNQFERRSAVKLELDDGGREEFEVSATLAERAARLFGRTVRAGAVATRSGDRDANWQLETIDPWAHEDTLDALSRISSELAERGVTFDPEAWIKELE